MVDLHKSIRKWEIYFANLNPTTGGEQAGIRPVLVISCNEVNTALTTCTIIPFTSFKPGKKEYPTRIFIDKNATHLPKDSFLLIHQLRTISKSRLQDEPVGFINNPSVKMKINESLVEYFDL